MDMINFHVPFMDLAIEQAEKASRLGEIPIGAILVNKQDNILSTAHNQTVGMSDPSAHAEILALRAAGNKVGNYRLLNTTLYVTVEPCVMCMGAIVHARVFRVVFGARDPKWGAVGSLYNFAEDDRLNHRVEVVSGICETVCAQMMQNFFQQKRKSNL
jgi:tRNA(adenine34) deaminase